MNITANITNSIRWSFRTIVSGVPQEKGSNTSTSIVSSLERHDGRLAKAVRHLVIPFYPDQSFVPTKIILRIMKSTKSLASFSWNADYAIPSSILEALHHDHASALLKVTNHNRKGLPLDEALLSSPQLHTLDITIGCISRGTTNPQEGNCELPRLKTLIMRGGNLKVLRVRLSKVEYFSNAARIQFSSPSVAAVGPFHFRFQQTDTFPTLEELAISRADDLAPAYDLSAKHCSDWFHAMDWSEMRVLDLVSTHSGYLLREITGLVPKLHTLRFNPSSVDSDVLESFLETVPLLTDVKLVSGYTSHTYSNGFNATVTRVCSTIGSQLRSLQIECKSSHALSWLPDRFQEILGLCPQLAYFKSVIDGQIATGEWEGHVIDKSASYKYALMSVAGTKEPGMEFPYLLHDERLDVCSSANLNV
jgi:hypothetical protein